MIPDNPLEEPTRAAAGPDARTARAAWLSGRCAPTLALCPEDEIAVSAGIGVANVVSTGAVACGMAYALANLDIPMAAAVAFGLLTGAGVFHLNRITLAATDRIRAERAIRTVAATDIPGIGGRLTPLGGSVLRLVSAGLLSVFIAAAAAIGIHDRDTRAAIALEQARIDLPYIAAARERVALEGASIARTHAEAGEARASLDEARRYAVAARAGRIEGARAELEAITLEIARREAELEAARGDETANRRIALCEEVGTAPGCEDTSGIPGKERLWRLATGRADEAAARAQIADARLRELYASRIDRQRALDAARAAPLPDDTPERIRRARADEAAARALRAFNEGRAERIRTLVRNDPSRVRLDPESLAQRLSALSRLSEDRAFLWSMIGIAVVAFVLELMSWIAGLLCPVGEYALRRGRQLAALSHEMIRDRCGDDIADDDLYRKAEAAGHAARPWNHRSRRSRRTAEEIHAEDLRATLMRKRRANDYARNAAAFMRPSRSEENTR